MLLITGCSSISSADDEGAYDNKLEVIPVELTTHLGDQQQFVEGDELQFLLSLGQDAYIYMFYVDAAGNITQILPNENQASNFYTAGYFLTIPEYENLYRFIVSEPFGRESITIFASDRSIVMKRSADSIEEIKHLIKRSSEKAYGEYGLNINTVRSVR